MAQSDDGHVVVAWIPGNKVREAIPDAIVLVGICLVVSASLWLQSIDPQSNWFTRSGAVVVLLGAVLEYRHNNFASFASAKSIEWASGIGGPTVFELSRLRKGIGYIAHTCIVVGTFIAAYGDLILAKL
ncbi:hypothetical protein ABIC63_002461 [Pseudacidovorax sp. 1753]|uniref:hypothetical protein n=1 Tax=Pseudacidovorax sp. 1753 TaxID=3156419 RepID=UPI00339938DC